ncbi:creatininase family protein [Halovivax cerinus]|uniref:Creatininase family protein n=1 Tax=Halovivax cerinus TaxID=1487865 RepID=A0ABD5NP63_9EURY|nr:creatininase family protein [Halovivax cerinus]
MTTKNDSVLIEELSWTEVADKLENGYDTAVLACGAIEQHGPHLPTGVDNYLGYSIAEGVANRLGNALVAPTIRPGCSDHHVDFPGTFSISRETFVRLLTEYCESLARMGFENIALIPSHGGNVDVMRTYTPKIAIDLQDEADVYFVSMDFDELTEYCEENDIPREVAGVHAGLSETARMLYDYGELVDMDKAEEGMTEPAFYEPERIPQSQLESFTHGVREQVANGILGDARGATAELGEDMKEILVRNFADEIQRRIDNDLVSMDVPDSVAHEYD